MRKLTFIIFLLGLTLAITEKVRANQYPIPELGYCRDRRECHLFCENPANHASCWSFSVYGSLVLGETTPETKVASLGITFPIAELGNCQNLTECKAFCSQTQNTLACKSYSDSHGLTNKESIVTRAKTELGCTTNVECKTFCEQAVNHDICTEFAKRYNLKQQVKNELLETAKKDLGCTTREQCKLLCSQPQNRNKCQALSRKFTQNPGQLRKEELLQKAKEILGCTSFEECKAFCQNEANRDKCKSFGEAVRMHVETKQKNQGKCTTSIECRKQCEEHPELCPNFPKKPSASETPKAFRPGSSTPQPKPLRFASPNLEVRPSAGQTEPEAENEIESGSNSSGPYIGF